MKTKKETLTARINTWLLLGQTLSSVNQCEDKEYTKIGISIPQFYILAGIKYLPAPVTTTAISRWVDRRVNTVALVLDQMEKKELVKRERNLPDRREMRLTLTPKSEKIFARATVPLREMPNDVMSSLTYDELLTLSNILQKIRKRAYSVLNLDGDVIDVHDHRIEVMTNVLRENG